MNSDTDDLSSFQQSVNAPGWTKKCLTADVHAKSEPWRRIPNQDADFRSYVILLWLQNKVLRDARKKDASAFEAMEAKLKAVQAEFKSAKAALTDQILQGAELDDYKKCWFAWMCGEEAQARKAQERIERKRADWRAERSREAERQKKKRLAASAELVRNRPLGVGMGVGWFAPMPIYNFSPDVNSPWGYCQATGQDRWTVREFLKSKKQQPIATPARKSAGRPLSLYGFDTNLLVLDKWLADWLLESRTAARGILWFMSYTRSPKAECVTDAIRSTLLGRAASKTHQRPSKTLLCGVAQTLETLERPSERKGNARSSSNHRGTACP
jgi:hypothetical protein